MDSHHRLELGQRPELELVVLHLELELGQRLEPEPHLGLLVVLLVLVVAFICTLSFNL